MNTKFEENKLKRELMKGGEGFEFYTPAVNEFGEPVEGGVGTNDYRQLINKPQINGVTLIGNLTTEQLGIREGISDAPADGNQYGRQNGMWTPIVATGGGGISEAETDPVYTADKPTLALKAEIPDVSNFSTRAEMQAIEEIANGKLGATAQAIDSAKLGGLMPQEFATAAQGVKADTALQAEVDPTVDAKISTHNINDTAHNDIRSSVNGQNTILQSLEIGVGTIKDKIPTTATNTNQLADKAFVNSSIEASAARGLNYDGDGAPFPAKPINDQIDGIDVSYFFQGQTVIPSDNDYIIVSPDANYSGGQVRYGREGNFWVYRYKINDAPFTQAQIDAINSGVTAAAFANKANRAIPTTSGNLATLDSLGNLMDGGVLPTSLPPSGEAGGDLAGNYPNPTLKPVALTENTSNNSVSYGGSLSTEQYTFDGQGRAITKTTITNTLPLLPFTVFATEALAAADRSGFLALFPVN